MCGANGPPSYGSLAYKKNYKDNHAPFFVYFFPLYSCLNDVFHKVLFKTWFQAWPDDALLAVSTRFLSTIELTDLERKVCTDMCQTFHTSTQELAKEYLTQTGRHTYVTPTSYLELINTFKDLLDSKRK